MGETAGASLPAAATSAAGTTLAPVPDAPATVSEVGAAARGRFAGGGCPAAARSFAPRPATAAVPEEDGAAVPAVSIASNCGDSLSAESGVSGSRAGKIGPGMGGARSRLAPTTPILSTPSTGLISTSADATAAAAAAESLTASCRYCVALMLNASSPVSSSQIDGHSGSSLAGRTAVCGAAFASASTAAAAAATIAAASSPASGLSMPAPAASASAPGPSSSAVIASPAESPT